MTKHTAEFYLQLEPQWKRGNLSGVKATTLTQGKPRTTERGALVVKMEVSVDGEVFEPHRPVVKIDIPAEEVRSEIEAHAEDAISIPAADEEYEEE